MKGLCEEEREKQRAEGQKRVEERTYGVVWIDGGGVGGGVGGGAVVVVVVACCRHEEDTKEE